MLQTVSHHEGRGVRVCTGLVYVSLPLLSVYTIAVSVLTDNVLVMVPNYIIGDASAMRSFKLLDAVVSSRTAAFLGSDFADPFGNALMMSLHQNSNTNTESGVSLANFCHSISDCAGCKWQMQVAQQTAGPKGYGGALEGGRSMCVAQGIHPPAQMGSVMTYLAPAPMRTAASVDTYDKFGFLQEAHL